MNREWQAFWTGFCWGIAGLVILLFIFDVLGI